MSFFLQTIQKIWGFFITQVFWTICCCFLLIQNSTKSTELLTQKLLLRNSTFDDLIKHKIDDALLKTQHALCVWIEQHFTPTNTTFEQMFFLHTHVCVFCRKWVCCEYGWKMVRIWTVRLAQLFISFFDFNNGGQILHCVFLSF
jgi:hypothetical protein